MVIHSTTLDTMDKVIAIYGGTKWVKIEGRMLLGQSDDYAINAEGGEATHTLTKSEMPSHSHTFVMDISEGNNSNSIASTGICHGISGYAGTITTTTSGNSSAHNNMPPYKVVYIWERTE